MRSLSEMCIRDRHCDPQGEDGLKSLAAGFRTENRKEAGRYLDTRAYQKRSRRAPKAGTGQTGPF